MYATRFSLLAAAVTALVAGAAAQVPSLVEDINSVTGPNGSSSPS